MRVLLLAASLVLLAVGQAQAAPSPFATFKSKREARAAFAQFESGLAQHKVGRAAARVGTQPLAEPGMPASKRDGTSWPPWVQGSSQLRELYREFLKRQGLEFSGAEVRAQAGPARASVRFSSSSHPRAASVRQ